MSVTYRQLRDALNNLQDQQLDDNATVYIEGDGEFFEIKATYEETEDNVLHKGHFVLVTD